MSIVTIHPADGGGDIALLINAALADPAVTKVVLGPGLFLVHSPIFVPSGKTLEGTGRDQTTIKAADDFTRPNPGESDGVVNTDYGASGVALSDFAIDASSLYPGGFRLVGCFMRHATDFTVTRVDVSNTTGYAHMALGDTSKREPTLTNGRYEDCATFNAQIHFEQMQVDGVTLVNCHARDGAGTLNGTYFHPIQLARNITYIDCTASGWAHAGVEMTANAGRPLENIAFINCSVEMFSSGPAFYAGGSQEHIGISITGSRFIAQNQVAMLVHGMSATIEDTLIRGEAIGLVAYQAPDGSLSDILATNSVVIGLQDPAGGGAAFAIGGHGGVRWEGGTIEARGSVMIPFGSGGVTYSAETRIVTSGFGTTLRYTEGDGDTAFVPMLAAGDPAASWEGGSLVVVYDAWASSADRLGIADGGSGAGQASVGSEGVLYQGVPVATISGGGAGEALTILFGAGATGEAVSAVLQAIRYSNASDDPALKSRALTVRLTGPDGSSTETSAVVIVSRVDDAATLAMGAASSTWAEGAAPVAVAPAIALADVDTSRLPGGSVTVALTAGSAQGDRLTILDQGGGPGAIGLAGASITYGGVVIGTHSGGEDGEPLLLLLNDSATLASVEALLRAAAFSSGSDDPGEARTVSFTLTETTGAVIAASTTLLVAPVDDDPAAVADRVSGGEDRPFLIDAAANDDPDGPPPLIAQVEGMKAVAGEAVRLASGALVTLSLDGTLLYDADGAFNRLGGGEEGSDSFTYRLANGSEATVFVTIAGANDAPGLVLAPPSSGSEAPSFVWIEGDAPAPAVPDAALADPDSGDFAGGALTVSFAGGATPDDRLTILPSDALTVEAGTIFFEGAAIGSHALGESGALTVFFTADATQEAVQAVLRSVGYSNISDTPLETRTLLFSLSDGDGGSSGIAELKVTVLPTDDPAEAQDDESEAAENGRADIAVTANDDPDSEAPAVLGIAGTDAKAGDTVVLASGARVTLNPDSTLGYDPSGAFAWLAAGAAATDSFTYSVEGGSEATVFVRVTGVNDAPSIGSPEPEFAWTEGGGPAPILPDASLWDPDSAAFGGGTLTVRFGDDSEVDDSLSVLEKGGITLEGDTVLFEGTAFGSVSRGAGGSLIIQFNEAAGTSAAEALLRAIGYSNGSDTPSPTRTVTFTLSDGSGGTSEPLSVAVKVTATDDAPTAVSDAAGTSESEAVILTVIDNDTDPDGGDRSIVALGGVEISPGGSVTLESGAVVTLNIDGTVEYDPAGAFDWLAGEGSGAANRSAVDSFSYTLAGGSTAVVRVTVSGLASSGDHFHGSDGEDRLSGTAAGDLFRLEQGGSDSASGGLGDDAFIFGAALDALDVVDGGEGGRDQLGIQGDYSAFTFGASNLGGIETLAILSGSDTRFGAPGTARHSYDLTTLDSNVASGKQLVVNMNGLLLGENVRFDGSAETDGNFFFYGGGGTDHLIGGAKADSFFFGDGLFSTTDRVVGGSGKDQLGLRGTHNIVFGADTMSGIETLALVSESDTRFGSLRPGSRFDIATHDANVAAGEQLSVNANGLLAGETLVFDGSAELDGFFRILSGKGDDILTGGAGNDIFYGNGGKDRLTGGGGADLFVYRSAAESTGTRFDTIVDFEWGADRLDLPGSHRLLAARAAGAIDEESFDTDLAAAIGSVLQARTGLFVTATGGSFDGKTFLVVDGNGIEGYQAGGDFVFEFASPPPPGPLPDFLL